MAEELKPNQVIIFVVGLALLGALAWGVGWMAHDLFERGAAPPPAEPTMPPTAAHSPTHLSTSPHAATPTQPPTETHAPAPATSTHAPTEEHNVEVMVVKANDRGAYDVVRRACELTRDYVLNLDDEIVRETWQLNGLVGAEPAISVGQEIQVPVYLCP
jgi:hypothetical protein